ncbi:MAG TPA: hypothetical protein VFQ77_07885 [Pseudonocardiaceae bacterium]|jgi:hypothetical protein|nr:hypothetical protein [Pseudonocardiaceae bacterium]
MTARAPDPDQASTVSPDKKLPDGRWAPGTLVMTPHGQRGRVLPYTTEHPSQYGNSVFVHLLARPERPWQLWDSSELTAVTDDDPTNPPR